MKKIIVTIAAVLSIAIIKDSVSQIPFNKHYYRYHFYDPLIQTQDGGFVTIIDEADIHASRYISKLIKFDSSGDSISVDSLPYFRYTNYFPRIAKSDLDNSINVTCIDSTNGQWGIHLTNFNDNGIIIGNSFYPVSNNRFDYSGLSVANGNYLQVCDIPNASNLSGTSLVLFNNSGVQWIKSYSFDSLGYILKARKNINGGYTIFAVYASAEDFWKFKNPYFKMIQTNDLGDTLWTKDFSINDLHVDTTVYYNSFNALIDQNGAVTFLSSSYYYSDSTVIAKLSPTGEKLWIKANLISQNVNSFNFSNNNEYLVGGDQPGIFCQVQATYSRYDTSGNLLWSKIYRDTTCNHYAPQVYSFINTFDNRYALSGIYDLGGHVPDGSFILTTDLDGNIPESVSAGIQKENHPFSKIKVYPNPCSTCELRGADDANDIIVTDILGRKLNASFTKTSQGFIINFPNSSTGIYFIKNIKTGEAAKFVKE